MYNKTYQYDKNQSPEYESTDTLENAVLVSTVYWYNQRVESIQHDEDLMSLALIHTSRELPKFYSFINFKLCTRYVGI